MFKHILHHIFFASILIGSVITRLFYLNQQKQSYFSPNCTLPWKLFLATNEFQAFASFSASPSFLRHIMFYGCFSKPINFDQSAKFLGAHCLKITQNVAFYFWILAFFTNFCPIIIDLSGYTIWPQASGFYN